MTDTVEPGSEAYEKYHEAGEILAQVLDEAAERVEVGASQLDVAEFAEARIVELGGKPAFPVNISVDEEASHASPHGDDETAFGEEIVCLDVGVHVDGYIADAARTVDLSGNPELKEAAEEALDAGLDVVEAGAHTGEIGAEVADVVTAYGYQPIVNLSGHGLEPWDAHTDPSVPNRGTDRGTTLEAGDVLAIEPFATTGSGKVTEGSKTEIYSLVDDRSVRDRGARQVLETVREEYRELPFAKRWLDAPRADMAVQRLETQGVLRSYPVLHESDGELVSQAEHTIIVTEDGYEITTDR
ncbi:type II methionyl aminopeptidase [Halarchaeum nitratireducens]|uniref:Methionine aminopeptidase n=1 Tax=Halarchaeum nitratireducens TaxID=489913 RepID=A0A830G6Q2_9EURY|nr:MULTISPECIES: type II methionyl aminopeptidase [Halarchaeum]MBP2251433.1 methionyl aminopeptidase [Halarchaeum solikamskense]GGN07378.1 type II methionyl aminopeptidase [Halarchaeum nitratireducens]